MPIENTGPIRLRGAAGDGRTDINEEINGNVTDTDVSLGTLNTARYATVADGTTVSGRSMSEMRGYAAFESAFPSTEADGALGESLLFDGSNYIFHRTPSLTSNRTTFTYSGWYKFNNLSSGNIIIMESGSTDGNTYISLRIDNTNKNIYGLVGTGSSNPWLVRSPNLFFDTSSWYHFVFAVDTTKDYINDRLRVYVNGIEIKFTYTANTIAQNQVFTINDGSSRFCIARTARTDQYAQFGQTVVADAKFIDGKQLRPDSFGELVQGIWIPKAFNTASTDTLVTSGLITSFDFSTQTVNDQTGSDNATAANISYYNNNYGIASFNGSSSRIYDVNSISFPFSLGVWINSNNTGSTKDIYTDLGNGRAIFFRKDSSDQIQMLTIKSDDSYANISTSFSIIKNNWYHILGVFDTNKISLYVNGQFIGTSPTFTYGTRYYQNNPNWGAAYSGSFSNFWDGYMADNKTWNRVLSASEALQEYNATKHKYTYGLNGFWLPLNNTSIGSIDSSSNLKLHLDASDNSSYSGSGTDWLDLTINNNDGTISGANYLSSTNGGVFDFDGSNDKIEITTIKDDIDNNQSFSLECWFSADSGTSTEQVICGFAGNSSDHGVDLEIKPTTGYLFMSLGNPNINVTYNVDIRDNKWHHAIITYTTSKMYLYVDGKLQATQNSHTTGTFVNDFHIGTWADDAYDGYYFNGKVAQVRIYDKALTAQEVITNYRATQGNYEQVSTVDISGNANSFTATNIDATDHIKDEPLDNYATLNPADLTTGGTISEGNLKFASGANGWNKVRATLAATSGKWYFEMLHISALNNSQGIGIADANAPNKGNELWGQAAGGINYYGQNGYLYENGGAAQTYSSTYGSNTRLMCAFDMDAGKIWFGRNGTWIGDPVAGTGAASTTIKNYITAATPFAASYYSGASMSFDFGQNGFTYTPPTGFKALTTSNLAAPAFDPNGTTPDKPSNYFKAVIYQGNGGTQGDDYGYKDGSRAAVFSGGSRIQVANASKPSLSTASISFWLNTTSTNSQALIGEGYSGNHWGNLQIYLDSNKLNARSGNASNAEDLPWLSTSDVNTGDWVHCVVTISGNTSIIYINGIPEITKTLTVTRVATTNPFTIGQMYANGSLFTSWVNDCKIDEVRIFDKVLSLTEVGYLADDDTTNIDAISNLVAHYDMEGDANTANFPYGTGAIDSGQSAVFDGSLEIATNITNSNIPVNSDFSISGWINISSTGGFIFGEGSFNSWSTAGFGLQIRSGSNDLELSLGRANGSGGTQVTTSAVSLNTWYHILCVVDLASTLKIYINGVENNSVSLTETSRNSVSGGFYIGSEGTPDYEFNGKIDQVRFYSSALSASDAEALASETNVPTANLVAHYKLDGNANDETTNYNGTWSGTETYSSPAEFPTAPYNGTPTNVTFTQDKPYGNIDVGFQPDLVWVKSRSTNYDHQLHDSVRGAGKGILANDTSVEVAYNTVTSFDSNGFTVDASSYIGTNASGQTFVVWAWKAGGNSNIFNIDGTGYSTASAAGLNTGSLTPTGASINTESGISIVKLNSGGSTADVTVSHGLGVKPAFVLFKKLNSEGGGWFTWHKSFANESHYLYLQDSYTFSDLTQSSNAWGNRSFDNNVVSFRSGWTVETNRNVIIYSFAEIEGFSKFGSYTGNGSTDGPFVYTGFKPAFLLTKRTDVTGYNWYMWDNARDNKNPLKNAFYADTADAELNFSAYPHQFLSNGIKIGTNNAAFNANGSTYIYMAFAEDPVKYSNGVATLGDGNEFIQGGNYPEDNFTTNTWTSTGNNSDISIKTGFKPDFVWVKSRTDAYQHTLYDSVRGAGINHKLMSSATNSESSLVTDSQNYGYLGSFDTDGFTGKRGSIDNSYFNYSTNKNYVSWSWKAAGNANTYNILENGTVTSSASASTLGLNTGTITPTGVSANRDNGFSIVKWTGTGAQHTMSHGLSKPPEIIISKRLDNTNNWNVYFKSLGLSHTSYPNWIYLNSTVQEQNSVSAANHPYYKKPSSSLIYQNTGTSELANVNNAEYITYAWHSVPGFSKIGSYSGSNSAITIKTGFEPAFVMIKRTNATGSWVIMDNKREIGSGADALFPDLSAQESSSWNTSFDSNGFTISSNEAWLSVSGGTYIYMAFAHR